MKFESLKPGMYFEATNDPEDRRRVAYLLSKTKTYAMFLITGNKEPNDFITVSKTPKPSWGATWMHIDPLVAQNTGC